MYCLPDPVWVSRHDDEQLHAEIAEMFDGLDGHGGCSQYVYVPETGTLTEERSEAQKLNLGYGTDD